VKFRNLEFGAVTIDGVAYDYDVIIEKGRVGKRKKKASRPFREIYGHTPLTAGENIPWDCKTLVIGNGIHGALPVVPAFEKAAAKHGVQLKIMHTDQAIEFLEKADLKSTNAILHLTC